MKRLFKIRDNGMTYFSVMLLYLAFITAIIGFLGLGFGPIESVQVAFYIVISLFIIFIIIGVKRVKSKSFH